MNSGSRGVDMMSKRTTEAEWIGEWSERVFRRLILLLSMQSTIVIKIRLHPGKILYGAHFECKFRPRENAVFGTDTHLDIAGH